MDWKKECCTISLQIRTIFRSSRVVIKIPRISFTKLEENAKIHMKADPKAQTELEVILLN